MDLHAIPRLNRLKTILLTLLKYGFEDLISRLDLPEKLLKTFSSSEHGHYADESTWRRMRYVLEELGPTFVKLGQVLSLRSDLIPPELAAITGIPAAIASMVGRPRASCGEGATKISTALSTSIWSTGC